LRISPALTEIELDTHMNSLASLNKPAGSAICFLGGGSYDHFIPSAVDALTSRGEFFTAYTPYQAEASQGTLQAMFEFQSAICELTGMEVANASMYEGATALTEAVFLAINTTQRTKVVISRTVHPHYRETLAASAQNLDIEITEAPERNGVTDMDALTGLIDDRVAAVVMQSPNFFGIVEPIAYASKIAIARNALMIQSFDPVSLAVLRRPGQMGVDVAVGEGQSLGSPMAFGGPYLGLFSCKMEHVRKMPGRIVGETVDRNGKRAFTLTLQTREQHIRRDKATSNICTNQGLYALRSLVYLSLMGPNGLRETAELCTQKAHYAAAKLGEVSGLQVQHPGSFFKEFVIRTPGKAEQYVQPLLDADFHAGIPLGSWYPEYDDCMLVAVTEKRTKEEIDALASAWRKTLK
jgi:glycine dehydrogenase subunit 1